MTLRLAIILWGLGVGVIHAAPQSLQEWVAAQETRDLVVLLRRVHGLDESTGRRIVASVTPQRPITAPRQGYDAVWRAAARRIVTAAALSLADWQDAAALRARTATWVDGISGVPKKLSAMMDLITMWSGYRDYSDGAWITEDDGAALIAQPPVVVYVTSPAVTHGWGRVTATQLMAAIAKTERTKQQARR